jgi:Type IV secretion-system coupling protein DNA-binding domain
VLDELASLQRLPQLHTAITENRKSKNPLVLGFQGKAQLEMIYGHLAEVMLSQPTTKIFLRTTEPKAADWVSNAIGKSESERLRETHSTGLRAGNNFSVERQVEPLVLDAEISGLPDRHAFLKLGNHVSRFAFDYWNIPATQPAFVPRPLEDDDLTFEPITLAKRPPKSATTTDVGVSDGGEDEPIETGVRASLDPSARRTPALAYGNLGPSQAGRVQGTTCTSIPRHRRQPFASRNPSATLCRSCGRCVSGGTDQ